MTRRGGLNGDVVQRRLREMNTLLDYLDEAWPFDTERLAEDWRTRLAVERALTLLVELALNINTHVIAAEGRPPPEDYRGSFTGAAEVGMLSTELATRLAPSAGTRNVLVHEYLSIDPDQVVTAAERARSDFRDYVRQVSTFLRDNPNDHEGDPN